jgi:hypothetical protein
MNAAGLPGVQRITPGQSRAGAPGEPSSSSSSGASVRAWSAAAARSRRIQPVCDLVQIIPEQAGVDVERHRCEGVPEHPLHSLDIGAGRHGRPQSRTDAGDAGRPLIGPCTVERAALLWVLSR